MHRFPLKLERLKATLDANGDSRSQHYANIAKGLWCRPVKCAGSRTAAWPEHENRQIIAARIAGKTTDEIRELVKALEAARKEAA